METKRRGFLGLFAGAAVLAPSGILPARFTAPPVNVSRDYGCESVPTYDGLASKVSRLQGRISDAQRYLRGELTDAEKAAEERVFFERRRQLVEGRVHALRSVSPVRKNDMIVNACSAIEREARRRDTEWDITRWLKELEG